MYFNYWENPNSWKGESLMDVKQIKLDYFNYITENTKFIESKSNSLEVVTPFIDSFGDGISFVIIQNNHHYTLTDQGFTIWNLQNDGINLMEKSSNHYQTLQSYLNYFGFSLVNENIQKDIDENNLPQAIHDMTHLLIHLYGLILVNEP